MRNGKINDQGETSFDGGPETTEESSKERHQVSRRGFLQQSMALGVAGLAAYVSPKMAAAPGSGGSALLEPIPGSNQLALDRFNASPEAQQIANYLQANYPSLRLEQSRAALYPDPADHNLPAPTLPEERMSLIGESAYQGFLSDNFAGTNFTANQISVLGSSTRTQLSRDLGRLIHVGGPILAMSCCCCCCCCSICSCSSNDGDQGGDTDLSIAAVTYGDQDADYSGTTIPYFRAYISVDVNGRAVGLIQQLESFDLDVISIEMISFPNGGPLSTTHIDPGALTSMGPDAYAQELWGSAA